MEETKATFLKFPALFTNNAKVVAQLPVPTQEEIKNEPVTFCWCPFGDALEKAGPLTRKVLESIEPMLLRKKKFVFVDSKVQFFKRNDCPIDSLHWHVDGSISVEDERTKKLGHILLHDMYARMKHPSPPTFHAYQSSVHCATEYVKSPLTLSIPKCIPTFQALDDVVNEQQQFDVFKQPAASIVSFDGFALHRAVPASDEGWRLWVRVKETDHFTAPRHGSQAYGTTFTLNK